MIGVAIQPAEREIAAEFFELFKTPWEFFRAGEQYDALFCTTETIPLSTAKLVLIFSESRTCFDAQKELRMKVRQGGVAATPEGGRLELYGTVRTFSEEGTILFRDEALGESLAFATQAGGAIVLRIGYNLFAEARLLLSSGQPAENASAATLEMHISLLRDWITGSGIALAEIPPVPYGHEFIACLTHDIDHPILGNHRFDHTMFGFLYRSTVGSLIEVGSGKKPVKALWRNWAAAGSLPLMHLGVAKDVWSQFDRYLDLESGQGATYFVIPREGYCGRSRNGQVSALRACRYDLESVKPQLERIVAAGNEVAVHGLDAWLDAGAGREEREMVSRAVGATEMGVRMHWLFFDQNSPRALEEAGFSYDSTFGYCDTVGFRAGTAQAYKPAGVARLLELPLHVMDTALFFPKYLNLDESAAEATVWELLDSVQRHGGAFTINWHDRSIAPERLWGGFYTKLVAELKRRKAWMPTAGRATAWFRKRRSAALEVSPLTSQTIQLKGRTNGEDGLPGLRIRVHRARPGRLLAPGAHSAPPRFEDFRLEDSKEISVTI